MASGFRSCVRTTGFLGNIAAYKARQILRHALREKGLELVGIVRSDANTERARDENRYLCRFPINLQNEDQARCHLLCVKRKYKFQDFRSFQKLFQRHSSVCARLRIFCDRLSNSKIIVCSNQITNKLAPRYQGACSGGCGRLRTPPCTQAHSHATCKFLARSIIY